MKDFSVTILGNGAAVPTAKQNPASQLVKYKGKRFLIDCGDGTQLQMIRYHTGFKKLNHIFISHLHGDHFYGLAGLISTFHMYRREEPLHIYAHAPLESWIKISLEISDTGLRFPLEFHPFGTAPEIIYEDEELTVRTIPLKHGISSNGFLFSEKPAPPRIDKEFVKRYNPAPREIQAIKSGAGYTTPEGTYLKHEQITSPAPPPAAYAYCSDTAFNEEIIPVIKGATLLYHETTFDSKTTVKELEDVHSRADQAALIAKKAGVKKLLTGHYSARLEGNYDNLIREARSVFPETYPSEQGKTYYIR